VKQSEFVRELKALGVEIKNGTKHLKLYYNGKRSTLPRHPSEELKTGLVEGVRKQLGLK
jgi:mRNA interferase HicA